MRLNSFRGIILGVLLMFLFTGALSGCVKKSQNVGPNGKKVSLTINIAGSLKEGKNDSAVRSEIEKRFQQDTGIRMELDLRMHTNEDFNTKVNLAISANEKMDGIVNNLISNDGLSQFMTQPGFAMALNELLDQSGANIINKLPQAALKSVTIDGKILAIPGVHNESEFGILIRKDWVAAAGLELPQTLDAFENVLRKFKERGDKVIPLVGFPWDLDRVLLPGAYGVKPYFQRALDSNGKLVPAYLIPEYKAVLTKMYQWVNEGLWDRDNTTRPTTSMDNLFISGNCGVYVQWPEVTHLIDIARKCKAANPEAEFAIIGPLKGQDGAAGFAKQPIAFTGCLIPQMSQNAREVVAYFNWLYEDVKNFELAAYGIEGVEWIDAGAGIRSLPDGKEDEYMLQPPYSGAYKLLVNVDMSDRILSTYTEDERKWIQDVRSFPVIENPGDGLIFPAMADEMKMALDAQYKLFAGEVVQPAWAGLKDPKDIYDAAIKNYRDNSKDYLEFINDFYQANKK